MTTKITKRAFEKALTKKHGHLYVDTFQDIDHSNGPDNPKVVTLNLYYSDKELMKHVGTWQHGKGTEF